MIFEVIFDLDGEQQQLDEIEKVMSAPDFWEKDQDEISRLTQRRALCREKIDTWQKIYQETEDIRILAEMALEEDDKSVLKETKNEIDRLEEKLKSLELQSLFRDPDDKRNAIVAINAGAGGTEAQDWVGILLRMYLRWAEARSFATDILDYLPGDEAGTKSVTILIKGKNAYGYLRSEVGIHRLVRISPFDSSGRRHTSFASVMVLPELDDTIEIDINEKDLRIDTYRASGAGGQHVNKTDSAIRITHLPTGIVVQCQNERSQHRNKDMAMKMLMARLYEKQQEEQAQAQENLHGDKKEIAWGSQIRSYVLQPYRMIKDHRTGVEEGNVDAVLDGRLDPFIKAYLLWQP